MPIWPPVAGLPMDDGLSERVVHVAQDSIHPPVRVDVSHVIHNDLHPNHAIVVIRVRESREAPHAVEKNTRVYVYGRTANKNEPYELANIERIEYLLNRKSRSPDRNRYSESIVIPATLQIRYTVRPLSSTVCRSASSIR